MLPSTFAPIIPCLLGEFDGYAGSYGFSVLTFRGIHTTDKVPDIEKGAHTQPPRAYIMQMSVLTITIVNEHRLFNDLW